ncbi:MAG: hypothetical protein GFH27_549445n22 [Chloroflexi bacterium AL-W]|nr:hypothetical protein [Chloroflexi bacterium AL-N1]NOK71678.1 hypothetical protein [Chloroflexi bacterium AL-N10]NOK79019.1 hypothetical protein [Chloroflexi bacterium AL-N5]NOK86453.1 hypothetical protein [Chloroflexi bacterium AL-W]NOK93419.1 hypothetical protein [Chloroflexi bacterium AL-N15]
MSRIVFTIITLLIVSAVVPLTASAQAEPALLRVMHDSPDAPPVDVYVNGERVLENIGYTVTTEYLQVAPGQQFIQVIPTGQGVENAVIEATVDLIRGEPYTVVAVNNVANIQALVLSDKDENLPADLASVRVIHASSNTGAFDIRPVGSEIPFLTDQFFTSADYVSLPPGVYQFEVLSSETGELLVTSPEFRFEAGWVYSITLTGIGGSEAQPLQVRPSIDLIASA